MKIDRLIHRQDKRKRTFVTLCPYKVKKPRAVASLSFIRALIFCLGSHEYGTCLFLLLLKP